MKMNPRTGSEMKNDRFKAQLEIIWKESIRNFLRGERVNKNE